MMENVHLTRPVFPKCVVTLVSSVTPVDSMHFVQLSPIDQPALVHKDGPEIHRSGVTNVRIVDRRISIV